MVCKNSMESTKSINDFKQFLEINREKMYSNAERAEDISVNDEWMQEDEWNEICNIRKNE